MFGGFLTMNCQRSCLSVAIVAMSSKTRHYENGKWKSKPPEFHWDSEKKGMLLGAFFYGYLILQIPAGWLCMKFGGKRVLGTCVFIASVINALLPEIARYNEDFFFIARITQGFFLGVVLPSNHYLWGKWAPTKEKGTLISFSISGLSAGMLTAYPISGLLSQYGFAGGWPSVFYTFGGAGLLWTFAWYMLVSETPQEHPSISVEELAVMDQLKDNTNEKKQDHIPWCKIFSSLPVIGIIFANFTFDCSYYTLLITMPLFLRDVHKFNVATTGIVSAMPWFFMTIMISTAGFLADKARQVLPVGFTRKLFFNIGVIGSGFFLIIAGYVESSESTIVLLCVSVAFFGFAFSGFMVNPMDIAPKYGGTIIGISNSISTTPGFVGPAIVGIMTKHGTAGEWLEVFYGLAGVSIIGGLVYIILGSGKLQPWASYSIVDGEVETGESIDEVELGNKKQEETKYNINELSNIMNNEPLQDFLGEKNIDKMRDSG